MTTLKRIGFEATHPAAVNTTVSTSIAGLVCSRFLESGYPALANVSAVDHEGALVLRGRLSTYYLKQLRRAILADRDERHVLPVI